MDTTIDKPPSLHAPKRLPESQRSTYQFPVYRWINWLVVAGYGVGLGVMFFLGSIIGLPAAIVWPFLVFLFCVGVALLGKPKALLAVMLFYFLGMPSNRLLGLVGLPLPGFLDELFFVPFLAVIVMFSIQRTTQPEGKWFPLAFVVLGAISWYVNGKPSMFGTIRVTLVMLKFWIIWYFCRLACTFRDRESFWKWGRFYIYYAAIQYLYNCLWQRAPWPTQHWDHSGGVFGPEGTGAAHFVGYISVLALFLLGAWFASEGRTATKRRRAWMAFLGVVIAYDLVFMTDTKHAIVLMPIAFAPVLFHQRISRKLRAGLLMGGAVVMVLTGAYLISVLGGNVLYRMSRYWEVMMDSPKGDAYMAVTKDFHHLVHYPLFGAGPGRFFSQQASDSKAPLARRYVLPYTDEANRLRLTHVGTTRTGGSLLAAPAADILTLMGEFGWLGTALYMSFVGWVLFGLWRKAASLPAGSGDSLVYLSLAAGVLFLCLTLLFAPICTVPCVMFPWWILIGRIWDMPMEGRAAGDSTSQPPSRALLANGSAEHA